MEISRIWSRPLSKPALWFFLNRYLPFFGHIVVVVFILGGVTPDDKRYVLDLTHADVWGYLILLQLPDICSVPPIHVNIQSGGGSWQVMHLAIVRLDILTMHLLMRSTADPAHVRILRKIAPDPRCALSYPSRSNNTCLCAFFLSEIST